MKDYELLRIELLKTLLQMEEMLLTGVENKKSNKPTDIKDVETISTLPETFQMKEVFSVSEVADYLGVSTDSIYMMVRENQIPYVRIRRRILFYKNSINSWINTSSLRS